MYHSHKIPRNYFFLYLSKKQAQVRKKTSIKDQIRQFISNLLRLNLCSHH